MPIQFERKVFTSGGSLRVNIPVEIAKSLSIADGDTIIITLDNSHIVMEKKKGKG
jgi:antitoxin component of MazEF toxin-antitoxin module